MGGTEETEPTGRFNKAAWWILKSGAIQVRNFKKSPPCQCVWNNRHEHEVPAQSSHNTECWQGETLSFPSEGAVPVDSAVSGLHMPWTLSCGFLKIYFHLHISKWRKISIFTVVWTGRKKMCQEERLEVCVHYSPEPTVGRKTYGGLKDSTWWWIPPDFPPELVSASVSTIWRRRRSSASQWCVSWAGNSGATVFGDLA